MQHNNGNKGIPLSVQEVDISPGGIIAIFSGKMTYKQGFGTDSSGELLRHSAALKTYMYSSRMRVHGSLLCAQFSAMRTVLCYAHRCTVQFSSIGQSFGGCCWF